MAYAFLDGESDVDAAYARAVEAIGGARERLRGPVRARTGASAVAAGRRRRPSSRPT